MGKGELRFYPGVGWKHAAKWQDRSRVPIPDMDREREESGNKKPAKRIQGRRYIDILIAPFCGNPLANQRSELARSRVQARRPRLPHDPFICVAWRKYEADADAHFPD